jgi:hypothetical protein
MLKEKDRLFKEHVELKNFIPEFEQMEKSSNKLKFIVDMKERCTKEEFLNYLYQFTFVQQGRFEEMQKKVETLQGMIESKEVTMRNLELTNEDLKKQVENKKKIIAKMKE